MDEKELRERLANNPHLKVKDENNIQQLSRKDGNLPFDNPVNELKLVLPYPPTVNHLYATIIRPIKKYEYGKLITKYVPYRVLSAEGKLFKKIVENECRKQNAFMLKGDLILIADVYRPMLRGDLSNRIKALEDSLKNIAFEDDEQISKIVAERYLDRKNPRVELILRQRE